MLQNSFSADSAKVVKRTDTLMSMYLGTINYMNKYWDALTEKEVMLRVKAALKVVLGKSFP